VAVHPRLRFFLKPLAAMTALLASSCTGLTRGLPPSPGGQAFLVLKRNACPVYELTVYEDGTLTYEAHGQAAITGQHWKRLAQRDLAALLTLDTLELTPELKPLKPDADLNWEKASCWGPSAGEVFMGARRARQWHSACWRSGPPNALEDRVLQLVGGRDWVKLTDICVRM
jgi:hypothetical protein